MKLPEKVITKYGDGETCGDYYSKEAKAINQLIDYLAEKEQKEQDRQIRMVEVNKHPTYKHITV